eukprot:jgi/Psemu1/57217/gm1.57217_g
MVILSPPNKYPIHTGAGAYQIQAIPKLIRFYHAAAGYPTKETWVRAIERGSFATWLGLTAQRVNRYLPLTEETTMGHLQMVRQGIPSPTTRGVTPDTSIDNSRNIGSTAIRDLRDQLVELEHYHRDILEYTKEQNTQLQTQNRLLYDYTEDSEDSATDTEMSKKKDHHASLKDHLDEAQAKPALANALAEVPSIKYIQGGGYAFLLETEEQYHSRDPQAPFPEAPQEPQELDSAIELTSDAYKLWKRNRALYVEWNKDDREALLITDRKFPNMLGDLKDPGLDAFPRGTTALETFQAMEEDLCTTNAQHQLTRELTKKMNALTYTPSPIGPKEYFRQLTKYQYQINLLPETANVTEAQMIDYLREAFASSKHDPITLHRVDKDWKKYRDTLVKSGFTQYKKFWGQRLKELYSSYHNNTSTANLADIQADQRFTELENKQRDLANVCHETYSQVTETATAASTMTMTNQWETAMAVLQADVNRLKAADASRTNSRPDTRQPSLQGWKQYKYYFAIGDATRLGTRREPPTTIRWVEPPGTLNDGNNGRTTILLSILRDPSSGTQPWPPRTVTFTHDVAFHARSSPGYGALDSAATDHFVPTMYQGGAHQDTPGALTVGCANGSKMLSTATDLLDVPRLPPEARGCHNAQAMQ